MKAIIITLILSIIAGILYRLGGKRGFDTKFRDCGCPAVFILSLIVLGKVSGLWAWLSLIPSFGLMFGALTTYRYFLTKPQDYKPGHYALHGLMVSLAFFPLAIVTHKWLFFGLRGLSTALFLYIWACITSWDDLEEWGRGLFINLSVFLM